MYDVWELCGCICSGRVARCAEFGIPLHYRVACLGSPFRADHLGISGIPPEQVERKVGLCFQCSRDLYQEMWALRWDWYSRQSEEWAAEQG